MMRDDTGGRKNDARADASGVATLYHDHHGWLRNWLHRKLGNHGDAADLAHDTFVRLLSKDAPVCPREPRAFLTVVAQGLVANLHRHRKIEAAYLDALAAQPEAVAPDPETRAILLQTLIDIDRRLDGLPPVARRVFLMSQLDGLAQRDIADAVGISIATVQRHIVKALHACCFGNPAA
ncbi:MAG: sigma-70 family RNA polymerase sigma factor [Pandoraea sp.]|nr:sigma-70 family RNA polymerase sigma factor [Pandoraea sp.]MDR3396479.1 sigma-70 family RNA polymerase sigma factor [Pandoraea sp.]